MPDSMPVNRVSVRTDIVCDMDDEFIAPASLNDRAGKGAVEDLPERFDVPIRANRADAGCQPVLVVVRSVPMMSNIFIPRVGPPEA